MYSLPLLPRRQVLERVERVIFALGLKNCANQKIGTVIQRGISGGKLSPNRIWQYPDREEKVRNGVLQLLARW